MKTWFLVVGITMSLASVRFLLDAPSHLAAAVAGAGLAIASALCVLAAAVARLADDPPNLAPHRARPAATRHEDAKVPLGGPVR